MRLLTTLVWANSLEHYVPSHWGVYQKRFEKISSFSFNITCLIYCSRLRIHYRLGTLPYKIKELIENQYPDLLIDIDKFVLGNVRNLNDYENLIGFNFMSEKKI